MVTHCYLVLVGMFIYTIICVKADEYDYLQQARWYDQYKDCALNRQSPIELITDEASILHDMAEISFVLYKTPFKLPTTCENNGHTINIQLPKPKGYNGNLWQIYDKLLPHIMGGPLSPTDTYIAESVHFHWGSQDTHGSEHVIDSQRYALEMHIVHRNSKYATIEEAREHEDGLAVIAVLYDVQSSLQTDFIGLNNVLDALEAVTRFNKSSQIENFSLDTLISGLDTTEFFTYPGSLTTPPCSQAVTWLVFSHTIQISHAQMERFHHIVDSHDAVMETNYRALQAKGKRVVYLRKRAKIDKPTNSTNAE